MGDVEVFAAHDHIILQKDDHSLWCSRKNGELIPKAGSEIKAGQNVVKLDTTCKCFVGKLKLLSETDWRLLLVTKASLVGRMPLHGDKIYCVEKVVLLPLSQAPLPEELRSYEGNEQTERTQQPTQKEPNYKEKLERRLTDAILRMFNDSKSFYYSFTGDLTRSLLQQYSKNTEDEEKTSLPLWKKVDERFFWNYQMLKELTGTAYEGSISDPWIVPVLQGYYETMMLTVGQTKSTSFYVPKTSPGHTTTIVDTQPAVHQDDESSDILKEDDKATEKSTVSGGMPDVFGSTEEGMPKDSDLEKHHEMKSSTSVSESKDTNLEDTEMTPDPHLLESSVLIEDSSTLAPASPDNQNTHTLMQESPTLSSSHSDVVEDILLALTNTEERIAEEVSEFPTEKDSNPGNDCREDITSPFSPDEGSLNISYEIPEDSEDDPDGIASMLHLRKESIKGEEMIQLQDMADSANHCVVTVISRRSRHRAGTRYRRRGIDSSGAVANFVETEQIMEMRGQVASFLIIRGSIPVYWSQPGYKYRPPPVIERGHFETSVAFRRHFDDLFQRYQEQCIINLNNQHGREQILSTVYKKHALEINNPKLTYVAFDYHTHCKGHQLENAKILMKRIKEYIRKFKFTWIDKDLGVLCHQQGVFRVNCMDCLDRTNVIQSQICKEMLITTLHKLMVYDPEESLSGDALQHFQVLWANNGDAISRQYTGTDALKGDLTRYGERKIRGYMKDGYNSAHRYYRNLFTDTYRQIAIDLQQGVSVSDAHKTVKSEGEMNELEGWGEEYRESEIDEAKENCKATLYPNMEKSHILVWAMLECPGFSFLENVSSEQVLILLFNKEKETVHFANYDLVNKNVCCFVKIVLSCIKRIEAGPLGTRRNSSKRQYIRIHYALSNELPTIYYFTLLPLLYKSSEEDKAILESIAISFKIQNQDIAVDMDSRLQRKRSPAHQGIIYLVMPQHLVEDYDSDISDSCSEDDSKEADTPRVVSPVTNAGTEVQIKLTTPSKTEHNLLVCSITSKSAPTSPILKRHQIPVEAPNSSGESEVEPEHLIHQRSRSVDLLVDSSAEVEKQSYFNYPVHNTKSKGFSRFKTGIANKFKSKNKVFGDSVTPNVPHDSESSVKPSAIQTFKKTFTSSVSSLKGRTQKIKTKTTMISIK